jgi:hypothetical protein
VRQLVQMTVSFVNKIVVQPAHILEKINLGGVSAYHWEDIF